MPDAKGDLNQQNIQAVQQLNALRFRDNRVREVTSDPLSRPDEITESPKPSPLELPKESYTSRGSEEIPSRIADIERQRASQKRMQETASEFIGAPSVPSAQSNQQGKQAQTPSPSPRNGLEAPARSEEERGVHLLSARYIEQKKQEVQRLAVLMQEQSTQGATIGTKMLFRLVEGALGGASASVITGIILLVIMNMQMLNFFTFQNYKVLPKPSLLEIATTLLLDFLALAVTFILGVLIYYMLGAVVTVLKIIA